MAATKSTRAPRARHPVTGKDIAAGMARRFKQMISALEESHVADGWHEAFDRKAAARFVSYLEGRAAGKGRHGKTDDALGDFIFSIGQDYDYLVTGRLRTVFSRLAQISPAAQALKNKKQ